jgi:hypothetical protein
MANPPQSGIGNPQLRDRFTTGPNRAFNLESQKDESSADMGNPCFLHREFQLQGRRQELGQFLCISFAWLFVPSHNTTKSSA